LVFRAARQTRSSAIASMGIPRYLLRILSASLAAFSGFIDAWTAAVKTSVARVTRSPLSRRYRSRMASPIRDYSPKLLARRRNESMRGAPGVSGRPSRDYPSVCRARARAAGTKRCLVAPRLHPANTQKVAPNESRRGPKPLRREALIYDVLFVARRLSPQTGKGS